MASVAERFVAEWIDEHVGNGWRWKGEPEHLEFLAQYLVQKLETAAWEFGLTPDELLDAVDGASYEYVLFEVVKASARPYQKQETADTQRHSLGIHQPSDALTGAAADCEIELDDWQAFHGSPSLG